MKGPVVPALLQMGLHGSTSTLRIQPSAAGGAGSCSDVSPCTAPVHDSSTAGCGSQHCWGRGAGIRDVTENPLPGYSEEHWHYGVSQGPRLWKFKLISSSCGHGLGGQVELPGINERALISYSGCES